MPEMCVCEEVEFPDGRTLLSFTPCSNVSSLSLDHSKAEPVKKDESAMELLVAEGPAIAGEDFDPRAPIPIQERERHWSHQDTGIRLRLIGTQSLPVLNWVGGVEQHLLMVRHESGLVDGFKGAGWDGNYEIITLDELIENYVPVDRGAFR